MMLMNLQGWQIHGHNKVKNSDISSIMAFPNGDKNDFLETKDWDHNAEWTKDPSDVDGFAVIYHTVKEIRKKYPYLYLQAIYPQHKVPWDEEAKFNGAQYPHFNLRISFAPPFDETMIRWENDPAILVSFDNDKDYKQHAQAIWSHWSRIWFTFFLSKQSIKLEVMKNVLESVKDSDEYNIKILKYVDVGISLVYNEDFVDIITCDEDIVQAFLKNPKTPNFK
jgi:hypothetical protein